MVNTNVGRVPPFYQGRNTRRNIEDAEFVRVQRFSIVRELIPGDERHLWDTFHVWNSRPVEAIYLSLFPATIHNLIAYSHSIIDDPITPKPEDESLTRATPRLARESVANINTATKRYHVMTYEQLTMCRMLAMMLNLGNEDLRWFFGANEIPAGTADGLMDDRIRSPIFIDGIEIRRNEDNDEIGGNNETQPRNFDIYLDNIYDSHSVPLNVISYEGLENGKHYTRFYGGTNLLKFLPSAFLPTGMSNSSIDMTPPDTGLISITVRGNAGNPQFDLEQIATSTALPFYFVTYGRVIGQTIEIAARYGTTPASNIEPIIVTIQRNI